MAVRLIEIDFDTNAPFVQKQIDALKDELAATTKTVEEAEAANEEYTKSLTDAAEETQFFGTSLKDVKTAANNAIRAIGGMTKSLGKFKTALAFTGLGIFVIALGGLVSTLRSTEAGMNLVTRATAGANLGWRIFTKTLRDASNALKNLFTDQEESNSLTAEGEKRLRDLQDQINAETEALETNNNERRAKINVLELERAEEKSLAEDTTKNTATRIAASQKFARQTEEIQALRVQDIEDQKSIIDLQIEQAEILGENVIPLQTQAQDLQDQLTAAQLSSAEIELTNRNLLNTIFAAGNLLIEQRIALLKELDDTIEKETKKEFEQVTERADIFKDLDKLTSGIREKADAASEQLSQNEIDRQDAQSEAIEGTAAIASEFLQFSKQGAIFEALINFAVTATKIASQTGIGFFVAAPAILGALAGFIAAIRAEDVPEPPTFAKGGMINGRSHRAGGVAIEAEGGEFIINKASMLIPGVAEAAMHLNSLARPKFQLGGLVPGVNQELVLLEAALNRIATVQTVLVTEDLNSVQQRVAVTEDRATL